MIHSRWKTRITVNEEVYNRYRFFVNCTKYANVKEINKLTDVDIRFIVLETYRKCTEKVRQTHVVVSPALLHYALFEKLLYVPYVRLFN